MKLSKYFLVAAFLLLQTPLCFASSEDSINFQFAIDPFYHCNEYNIEVAVTKNSSLAINGAPECNSNRPTYGPPNSSVSDKFNRGGLLWKYAPHGVFNDGVFMFAAVGMQTSEFKSTAGSTANVSFIDYGISLGYQWFWKNGFNVSAFVSAAHLAQNSLNQSIAPTESPDVRTFLDQQTSTNSHVGMGWIWGWAF